ncbi:MAG: ATP-binding protein [Acidimicrobiales bacterium]
MNETLSDIVRRLREIGSDFTSVEVKAAVGGLPMTLTKSLSTLANLPGGGVIILGLDEGAGFTPVALKNVTGMKAALGQKARTLQPPVRVDIEDGEVDGSPVIVARVHECDPALKPCRAPDGTAYVRSWDGDYRASDLEEQAFLLHRSQPQSDRVAVPDATVEELDPELVALWRQSVRSRDSSGLGRFAGVEQLRRGGIVTVDGQPTLAGLLALGIQPQEYRPRLALQLSTASPGTGRARNPVVLTGPLPAILDQALEWARQNFSREVVTGDDGHVRDSYEYPLVAFRELVSNALVHRSFDEWAMGYMAEVILTTDRLVVTNPGGLYGITADRLGRERVTTSRNAQLVSIAQHATSAVSGARVIEGLATGIATVLEACAEAGLPRPIFQDTAVRFTAVLQRSVGARGPRAMTKSESAIFAALVAGERTAADLASELGTSAANVRKTLRALRERHLVVAEGGRGQRTTYRRA